MMPIRIPPEDLLPISHSLFNKSLFSGAELAREMGVNANTLWTQFMLRGLEPETARKAATVVDGWSEELHQLAKAMRELARLSET